MEPLEQRVERWITDHEQELLTDIEKLVRHRSISQKGEPGYGEGCRDAMEEMLSLARAYGLEAENADGLCGVITLRSGPRRIGLWGHLDVVPEGSGWNYPPYACTRKGDFLIGRGVQDNKGPAAAALYALRCIRDLEIPVSSTFQQIVGCAEETGMEDAVLFASRYTVPDYNIITDCGFPVCYGEKGMLGVRLRSLSPFSSAVLSFHGGLVSNLVPDSAQLVLTSDAQTAHSLKTLPGELEVKWLEDRVVLNAKGLSAHAAFPDGGINAIGVLCGAVEKAGLMQGSDREILAFLKELSTSADGSALGIACEDEESGPLTCVCGVLRLEGGYAQVDLNVRYPVTADAHALCEKIVERCAERGFFAVELSDSPPNYQKKDSLLVRCLTDSYQTITGRSDPPFVMGGGTYARKLPNAVAFGPGMPVDLSPLNLPEGHGGCHSPDEAQSIPNLLLALKIYVLSLIRLDQALSEDSLPPHS